MQPDPRTRRPASHEESDTGKKPARSPARRQFGKRHGGSSSTASPPLPAAAACLALGAGLYSKRPRRCRQAAAARRAARDDFPGRLRPLRPVRPVTAPTHPAARRPGRSGGGHRRISIARQMPARCARTFPASKACPTGALDRELTDINKARPDGPRGACRPRDLPRFPGLRCDVCYRVCPVIDKAITLETDTTRARPARHAAADGAFRRLHRLRQVRNPACCPGGDQRSSRASWPRARAARPTTTAKGWEEKARHGGSLIGEQVELPVRRFRGPTAGRRSATETVVAPGHPADVPASRRKAPPTPRLSPPGINSNWKP